MTKSEREKAALEIQATLNKALSEAQTLVDDLNQEVEGLSEKQAESEKGETLQERSDTVQEVVDQIEAAEAAISGIEW